MKAWAPSRASALPKTARLSSVLAIPDSAPSVRALRINFLVSCTPRGPLAATSAARANAAALSSARGTTWLTRPTSAARTALNRRPVRPISRAMAWGMRSGRRVPPPAANSPRLTSGRPKRAWSAATTRSQLSTSSIPPPTAAPLTAATRGFS